MSILLVRSKNMVFISQIALNRATDVKQRAEDVLASYRDATLMQHSIRPVHLPKSPNSMYQSREQRREARQRQVNDEVSHYLLRVMI